jgi:hypothetical protein
VVDGGAVDSMLQFQLERGDDETNYCRNMKRSQRAHLGSMKKKCDMVRWRDDVGRRRGGTREGKERRRRQLG